ncbi:MAG: hypothetical protein CL916_13565 [Deltaproteobacteria bacterium]|nr:hypothetical protein [Deltaproteobacteria bacterium]
MTKKNLIKTQKRVRENGEVFTPPDFAKIILAKWMHTSTRKPKDVFVDLQCGQGSLLGAVLEWKIKNGLSREEALSTILGVDIAQDNVDECRLNLLVLANAEQDEICTNIVLNNIIQGDSVQKSLHELFPKVY